MMFNNRFKCVICTIDLTNLEKEQRIQHFNQCIINEDNVYNGKQTADCLTSKYFTSQTQVNGSDESTTIKFTSIKSIETDKDDFELPTRQNCPFCNRLSPMTIIHIKQCASKKGISPKSVLKMLQERRHSSQMISTFSSNTISMKKNTRPARARKKPLICEDNNQTKLTNFLTQNKATGTKARKATKKCDKQPKEFALTMKSEEDKKKSLETKISLIINDVIDNHNEQTQSDELPFGWTVAGLPSHFIDYVVPGFEKYINFK